MARCPSCCSRRVARTTSRRTSRTSFTSCCKGSGVLLVEGTRHPFVPGDVLFVAANKVHRFEEFSQDLVTWAVFWGPQGGEAERP